ncbi:unnamed protein product [Lactuca virosa]|uniref:Ubiquitin-like protease family profile domain-containing protein n=1 Tax=Lactuca virosa TaxID=75947 RepID=A0AAU9NK73_9ASTR|nr:unnamed protein product [Lactuca virosa]
MMKQDESVLKTLEKKTTQEIRQSPRLHKTKTKKSMKQEKSVFKTPEKKTTQEIRQSPRLKMIEYKKSVTPIKVEDSLVKKESDEKITEQRKAVREMGLGSLLRIATNGISGKLARFVVNSFNPSDMKIHLPNAKIDITPELNKPGTCKTTVLPHLLGKTPMREIDWCGFITNCLKMSKTTWDETDRGNYYCGPLLVLLLAYLEFMRNDKNEKRQIHALHFWDYEMMMKREKAELKSGDFGTLEWNDDVIENDEESDTDENEDMKLDELVFKAKKDYKKLVNDKMKFGMLIEFSTTKFTESDELKDMKKVFEQEFIYKTQNEDDAKGDRDEDEKKSEENLNEHEIKNQTIMEGDESSEDEHMKKEIKDEKLDEGESYDSEETECDNNILGIEDDEDKKKENEKVFQTKRGYVLGRGMIETMQARLWVHAHVIDAWTDILNYEEKLKSNSTLNRYFFDTSIVRQFIFDKNIPFNQRFDKFESNIKDAMKKDKELLTFEKVHLVFLPVLQKNHFYIICINLEEPTVDVIDNRNSVAKFSRACRDAPNELVLDEGQSQISFNFGGC